MVCCYNDLLHSGTQIHGTTHSWHHLPWNRPVSDIAFLVYLKCTKNCCINMSATYKCKRHLMIIHASTFDHRCRLSASINNINIYFIPAWGWSTSDGSDLCLQPQIHTFWEIIYAHQRNSDTKIYKISIFKKLCTS